MIRVRELREAKGMQQKELAIDLCVSQPTISDWESGRKVPSAKSTQKLADYFNVSIDYLLGRDGEKKEPIPVTEDGQNLNIIKIAGRDGSFVERQLTDDQMAAFKLMLNQLPDVGDL